MVAAASAVTAVLCVAVYSSSPPLSLSLSCDSLNVFSSSALDFPWDMHQPAGLHYLRSRLGHSLEFRVPNISHRASNVIAPTEIDLV